MVYLGFGSCGKLVVGDWLNMVNRYLGVEFQFYNNGVLETHYGWIKASDTAYVDPHGNLQTSTLVSGFAYETVQGKSIAAGQMF